MSRIENSFKKTKILTIFIISILLFSSCKAMKDSDSEITKDNFDTGELKEEEVVNHTEDINNKVEELNIINDNYRTYYEVFVASFYDSNGDGIGDLKGLTKKLDYIKSKNMNQSTTEELGCNGIWLMPIMPSDTYHKYDVKDYYSIDESYGTLEDFQSLIKECDLRGIKLIIDLVMNHTSDQHPWFLNAISYIKDLPSGAEPTAEENKYFGYYNFKKDMESNSKYYNIGNTEWYYEGVFTSDMPDLNLENPQVKKEFEDIATFWMNLGVGGFRLDAAKEYFSGNDKKNVELLSWFNDYVKGVDNTSYIVAEVWSSFGTIAQYYESGIDSVFNYAYGDAAGKLAMTVKNAGNGKAGESLAKAMEQVDSTFLTRNKTYIDASFLSNHDNDRAAGYVSYKEELVKLLGGINLMMSGSSFIYYGEEIGMSGNGDDENKRAPMFWSTIDKQGMTLGPPNMKQQEHKFEALDLQKKDSNSIFQYYKKAICLRNKYPEIARGSVKALSVKDKDVAAISKTYEQNTIYILYNVSDEKEEITLDTSNWKFTGMKDYLTVNDKDYPELIQNHITLPAYSIVILY